jgi:hypothetical protein
MLTRQVYGMSQRAHIKLVGTSVLQSITIDDLKTQLTHYKDQLTQTGSQLDWDYADAAFPYTIEQNPEGENQWFYLKGNNPLYRYIAFGVENPTPETLQIPEASEAMVGEGEGTEVPAQANVTEPSIIQVILPDGSTIGDKSKGNELCKYLGKVWKAEVHMFNGRIMYFNPRK